MFRWGRPADIPFAPDEPLYWRFADVAYEEGRQTERNYLRSVFQGAGFRIPNTSVNRGRFSMPLDVLLPYYSRAGVVAFPTEVARRDVLRGERTFAFRPTHDPLADNFAHSEIRVFRDSVSLGNNESKKVHPEVKTKYRLDLAEHASLVRAPDPLERFAFWKRILGRT